MNEVVINGVTYTQTNCLNFYGYSWRTSASGIEFAFADDRGHVIWIRKDKMHLYSNGEQK